jgi:hypothetical protein
MKNKVIRVLKKMIGLSGIMLFFPFLSFAAVPVIIDHHCTNIRQIPESAIMQAKANLHIAYGHTSHGSQLISGMGVSNGSELDAFMNGNGAPLNLYLWNNGGSDGALDLHDRAMGGDVGYYPQWVNNTRAYLGDPDPITGRGISQSDVNVIVWSWCGQAASRTEQSMIDTYLAPMTRLEEDYPGITFVYMTGHLNGTGLTGNLHLRNEQIRAYCIANNKVLYDFADIESFDPDGKINYNALHANDDCSYDSDGNGSRDENWAMIWQNSHTQGVDWWASGAAHSQHLNGNLKGYAGWWLWAVLGGWDTDEPTVTITLTQDENGYDGCKDTYLCSENPTYNYGRTPYDYVINSPKTNYLVSFQLPDQVLDKKILNAQLGLHCWSVSSWLENQSFELYQVTQAWEEGTANGAEQTGSATWNVRKGADLWTTPGGSHGPEILATHLIPALSHSLEFDITGLVQKWADTGLPNYGVILKNNTPVEIGLNACENSDSGKPYLEIRYTSKACGNFDVAADGDVDGEDLAAFISSFNEICLNGFASSYGL